MDFDDLGFVANFQVKLFGQRSDRTPDYCFEVIFGKVTFQNAELSSLAEAIR